VRYAGDVERTIGFYVSILGTTHLVVEGGYHALFR
jgi:hypothetical protein